MIFHITMESLFTGLLGDNFSHIKLQFSLTGNYAQLHKDCVILFRYKGLREHSNKHSKQKTLV